MYILKTLQNLFKFRKNIDENIFLFFYVEHAILQNLTNSIKKKDKELTTLIKENNNSKLISFSLEITKLKEEINCLESNLEQKVENKIEELEKNKISKFKNLIIKIFIFWKQDKNTFINKKIKEINSNYEKIKYNCKKLNNYLISQQKRYRQLIQKNEWNYSYPDLPNKKQMVIPKM